MGWQDAEVIGETTPKWMAAEVIGEAPKMSRLDAATTSAAQGATLNTFDEGRGFQALIDSNPVTKFIGEAADRATGLVGPVTKGGLGLGFELGVDVGNKITGQNIPLPEVYTDARDQERGNYAKAYKDHPVTSFASEAGSSFLLPAIGTANKARVAATAGGKVFTAAKAGAKGGAVYGAASGFNRSTGDAGERASDAAKTGVLGAVGGAAFGAGGHMVGKRVSSAFPRAGGDVLETSVRGADPVVLAKTEARITKILAGSGVSSDDISRAFQEFQEASASGKNRLPLASFLKQRFGPSNPKVGEAIDNVIFDLREQFPDLVRDAVDDIKLNQSQRFAGRMEDISYKQRLSARDARLGEDLQDIGAEYYDKALSRGPVDAQAAAELRQLLTDPDILNHVPKSFLTRLQARRASNATPANALSGTGGEATPHLTLEQAIHNNPLRVAHEIYSHLGRKHRASVGAEKIGFDELRNVLRDPLFRAGGDLYEQGNQKYGAIARARGALDFGERLLTQAKNTRKVDELVDEFSKFKPGREQNSAIMAIRDTVTDAARSAREGDLVPLTQLRKDGVLDAIERILTTVKDRDVRGQMLPRNVVKAKVDAGDTIGRQMSDEIRSLIREAEDVKAWGKRATRDQLQSGREAYTNSVGRGAYGADTLSFGNLMQDGAMSAMMGQPIPLKTGLSVMNKAAARFVTPSRKVRLAMAKGLIEAPGAAGAQVKPRGGGSSGSGPKPPPTDGGPPSGPKGPAPAAIVGPTGPAGPTGPVKPTPSGGPKVKVKAPLRQVQSDGVERLQIGPPDGVSPTPNTAASIKPTPLQRVEPQHGWRGNRSSSNSGSGVPAKVEPDPALVQRVAIARQRAANKHAKAEMLRVKARGDKSLQSAKLEVKEAKLKVKERRQRLKNEARAQSKEAQLKRRGIDYAKDLDARFQKNEYRMAKDEFVEPWLDRIPRLPQLPESITVPAQLLAYSSPVWGGLYMWAKMTAESTSDQIIQERMRVAKGLHDWRQGHLSEDAAVAILNDSYQKQFLRSTGKPFERSFSSLDEAMADPYFGIWYNDWVREKLEELNAMNAAPPAPPAQEPAYSGLPRAPRLKPER